MTSLQGRSSWVESVLYAGLGVVLLAGVGVAAYDEQFYEMRYVPEDGLVEYTTAFFLFLVALLALWRLMHNRSGKTVWFGAMMVFTTVLFLFGAGEEISWGQRVIGFESTEFFQQNNGQAETNLHNLVVGETKINKIIFGQLLTLVLVLYFLVGPFWYARSERFQQLADRFYVPIPRWHHSLGFAAVALATVLIASGKRAELSEFGLSVLLFLVVWRPRNANIFARG